MKKNRKNTPAVPGEFGAGMSPSALMDGLPGQYQHRFVELAKQCEKEWTDSLYPAVSHNDALMSRNKEFDEVHYRGSGLSLGEVVEYRVFHYDGDDGSSCWNVFPTFRQAREFWEEEETAQEIICAVIRQDGYIRQTEDGLYERVDEARYVEVPASWLIQGRPSLDEWNEYLPGIHPFFRGDVAVCKEGSTIIFTCKCCGDKIRSRGKTCSR